MESAEWTKGIETTCISSSFSRLVNSGTDDILLESFTRIEPRIRAIGMEGSPRDYGSTCGRHSSCEFSTVKQLGVAPLLESVGIL